MAQQERYLYKKMSVPELNQLLSNASAACQQHNMSRSHFFELKKRFQSSGYGRFERFTRNSKNPPPKNIERIIEAILSLSFDHPGWGCVRLSQTLNSQGVSISSPTVQKILIKHNMGNKNERLCKLEEKALTEQLQLNCEQIALIEKSNPCFRERFHESNRPAKSLAQDIILVGFLKGVGKIYLQSVVDTFNSFTFGFLHLGKLPDCAVAILHNDVLPFYRQHNLQIQTIVTNNGREYCGTEKHHYELYLMLSEIEHRKTKLRDTRTNGFIKRFNLIVLDEFFKKFLQNKSYDTIEKLQSDFDQWLLYYNNERPHKGYRNMGLPPVDIFKNYLHRLNQ